MCFEFDYLLSTDGGAAANGSAGSVGYGSYCLEARTSHRQMVRLHRMGHAGEQLARAQSLAIDNQLQIGIACQTGCVQRRDLPQQDAEEPVFDAD